MADLDISGWTPQMVNDYVMANPGQISQATLDNYAASKGLALPTTGQTDLATGQSITTQNPNTTSNTLLDQLISKIQNNGTAATNTAAPTNTNNVATGQSTTTAKPDASTLASLFDSIMNSNQGTSALGEIASGTGTTPATTQEEFAKLMEQGTLDRKNAPTQTVDLTNTGQQQGNLNNSTDLGVSKENYLWR